MKRLAFIFLLLLITQYTIQAQHASYPFDVQIEGQGKPVILIPGLACSGEVWNATVEVLKKNYECHILTLAGFSTQKAINLDKGFLPIIQDNINKYIKSNFKIKPIIIGHSLGGFLALSLASSEPDLLEKIVIVDSYPFYSAAMNPNATEENSLQQAKRFKEMFVAMPDSTFNEQQTLSMSSMVTNPEQAKIAVKWSSESDRATVAQAMYEIMTTDLRQEAEQVKCPILVFGSWYAAKDYGITKNIVKQNYQIQFAKAKSCIIKVADTAKHFVMWDEAEWFHKELIAFL